MFFIENTKKELPVTSELARQHLRIGDSTHDDTLIEAKLDMAVGIAEDITGRWIGCRSVVFDVTIPVDRRFIALPIHTATVIEVSFLENIIPTFKYEHCISDTENYLYFDDLCEWRGKTVRIKATIGYTDKTAPPAIKAAILLILGTLYDNESDNIIGRSVSELSLTANKLLQTWRVMPYRD